MDSVNEAHAQHGCGSQWYSINGIRVVSESGLTEELVRDPRRGGDGDRTVWGLLWEQS